jgi:hypothetical protein
MTARWSAMVAATSGTSDNLTWAPAMAATSRATPVSDRQSARFGVSFSVENIVVEIEILADRLPDRRIGRQHQQARGVFGNAQFLGRTEHAGRLDAAHLGDLDREIAGQLAPGKAHGTRRPTATFGAPQTMVVGSPRPVSTCRHSGGRHRDAG